MAEKEENRENYNYYLIGLVIALIVVFITLGYFQLRELPKAPNEFKESKVLAKKRNRKLKEHLENQLVLKKKLDKLFKRIYFVVRLLLMLIWGGIAYGLIRFQLIQTLEDFLNFSEASLITLLVLNFLKFGTLTNLRSFINIIEVRTQNLVYGKYVNIEHRIEDTKSEIGFNNEIIKNS